MKGHKHHRSKHASGGSTEHLEGVKEYEHDKPAEYVYAGKGSSVEKEAEERKRGGKAKKNLGKAEGHKSKARADRAPRKSGGRTGANMHPLSSAHHGKAPAKSGKGYEMN